MAPGKHRIEYEVLEGWQRLPEGWSFVEVAGVACDSKDRVYVFNRGAHPVIVFDKAHWAGLEMLTKCGDFPLMLPYIRVRFSRFETAS